jgi:hypothetical protein
MTEAKGILPVPSRSEPVTGNLLAGPAATDKPRSRPIRVALITLGLVAICWGVGPLFPEQLIGINYSGFRAIRMGMFRHEVWAILGEPGNHSSFKPDRNRRYVVKTETKGTMVTWTSLEWWGGNDADITILYDNKGRVVSKNYWREQEDRSFLRKLIDGGWGYFFQKVRE